MVKEFLKRAMLLEPALVRTFIIALFAMLASAGVVIDDSIPDSIVTFVIALSAMAQALWVRQGVTANARVVVEAPDPIEQPGFVVAGEAVTMADDASIIEAATTERPE